MSETITSRSPLPDMFPRMGINGMMEPPRSPVSRLIYTNSGLAILAMAQPTEKKEGRMNNGKRRVQWE
ncbi:unnamed protein product [Lactuca virosa]|uniref:Uncharacterized protein n=1 Tax=Lactuca virosa TaxID=75947 RepID=A0AAU9PJC8_9ASTR|nr:unnamed protein product [Lactuca virosa]